LVVDGGDGLAGDGEPGESADLDDRAVGLGRGPVEVLGHEPLEVLASLDTLGMAVAVDGHFEAVAAGVDDPVKYGFELPGPLGRSAGSRERRLVGPAESVLVVVVGAFEPGEPCDVRVDRRLLEDERVTGGEGLDL